MAVPMLDMAKMTASRADHMAKLAVLDPRKTQVSGVPNTRQIRELAKNCMRHYCNLTS
ncbi:hypothetical protein I79_015052 [Cricetulus griseus]|uniref:Uncharacterized protein n=1 Tax=Cricetulus griseus TaxID=10029 RepID=G3HVR1_CRIGR|nr:hypothetical protein I79_015052 [Cricetulus griseus]